MTHVDGMASGRHEPPDGSVPSGGSCRLSPRFSSHGRDHKRLPILPGQQPIGLLIADALFVRRIELDGPANTIRHIRQVAEYRAEMAFFDLHAQVLAFARADSLNEGGDVVTFTFGRGPGLALTAQIGLVL